jgi:quinol-cytochrome oxidoreductase complex cytochrome b subunit
MVLLIPNSPLLVKWIRLFFYHLYFIKDLWLFFFVLVAFFYVVFLTPNILNHSDNFNLANPMVTPAHIVPEWYFLPFYAILRSIPSKVLGVVAMLASIAVFFALPLIKFFRARTELWLVKIYTKHFTLKLTCLMFLLGVLGALSAEEPFIGFAQFYLACIAFLLFLFRFIKPVTILFLKTRRHVPKWRPFLE